MELICCNEIVGFDGRMFFVANIAFCGFFHPKLVKELVHNWDAGLQWVKNLGWENHLGYKKIVLLIFQLFSATKIP